MAKSGKAKIIDIFVWEADTKKVISHIKGFHLRAIRLVTIKYFIKLIILVLLFTGWK